MTKTAAQMVSEPCSRCGGSGEFTKFHGVCFKCGGSGIQVVKAATAKGRESVNRRKAAEQQARAERITSERLAWSVEDFAVNIYGSINDFNMEAAQDMFDRNRADAENLGLI